ncbi:MAG: hypothetical protein M5U28_34415 [Sandaracinaceae bacterium]|nr:hypothetical protein [Sandaracinaceae bacterium]
MTSSPMPISRLGLLELVAGALHPDLVRADGDGRLERRLPARALLAVVDVDLRARHVADDPQVAEELALAHLHDDDVHLAGLDADVLVDRLVVGMLDGDVVAALIERVREGRGPLRDDLAAAAHDDGGALGVGAHREERLEVLGELAGACSGGGSGAGWGRAGGRRRERAAQLRDALAHGGRVARARVAREVLLEELDGARRLARALERHARVVRGRR